MQVVGFNYNVEIRVVGGVWVEVWCGVVWCGIELSSGRGHGEVCLEENK